MPQKSAQHPIAYQPLTVERFWSAIKDVLRHSHCGALDRLYDETAPEDWGKELIGLKPDAHFRTPPDLLGYHIMMAMRMADNDVPELKKFHARIEATIKAQERTTLPIPPDDKQPLTIELLRAAYCDVVTGDNPDALQDLLGITPIEDWLKKTPHLLDDTMQMVPAKYFLTILPPKMDPFKHALRQAIREHQDKNTAETAKTSKARRDVLTASIKRAVPRHGK